MKKPPFGGLFVCGLVRRDSLGTSMCLALRAALPCKTAILPFCHSAISVPRPPGGYAVLIGCPTAMDGGSAENAGAFFGLPFCRTGGIALKPRTTKIKRPPQEAGGLFIFGGERGIRTLDGS